MTNELWKEMSVQSYQPKVDDYVKWKSSATGAHMEGWVYWIDEQKRYLTIEIMVREKTEQSYKDCSIHRNERCLVCCYPENWNELVYVRSR